MNLNKGLVGHWTMDDRDTSGGTLYDRSASDAHGNLIGGVSEGSSSIIGEAHDFDGSSGTHIDLGVVSDRFAVGRGDFTFSVWSNFDNITGNSTIFELSRYSDALLVRPSGNNLEIYIRNQQTNDGEIFPSIDSTTGVWTHFVIRRKNGTVEVFQDNSSITTANMDGKFEINQESYIGESVHSSGQSHNGKLSDMRFYNRALSSDEINALYQMRSPRTTNVKYKTKENIKLGHKEDDLTLTANRWSGSSNNGEISISGTSFTRVNGSTENIKPINDGVAARDGANGVDGYLMFSKESVHSRFSDNPPHPDNCNHLIGVVYDNGWKYDTNQSLYSFTPKTSDVLIAEVTFGIDSITKLDGFNF